MSFLDKLSAAQHRNNSRLCLSLDVELSRLPAPLVRVDDPMFPFARSIVEATRDLVCAYQIDLGYFLSEGAAGMIALERITRYSPENIPIILDAKFGGLDHSADRYARGAFEAYRADAVTFGTLPNRSTIEAFLKFQDRAVFLPGDDIQAAIAQARIYRERSDGSCGIRVELERLSDLAEIEADVPVIISAQNEWDGQTVHLIRDFIKSHPLSIVDGGSAVLYKSSREDYAEAVRRAVSTNRRRISE